MCFCFGFWFVLVGYFTMLPPCIDHVCFILKPLFAKELLPKKGKEMVSMKHVPEYVISEERKQESSESRETYSTI